MLFRIPASHSIFRRRRASACCRQRRRGAIICNPPETLTRDSGDAAPAPAVSLRNVDLTYESRGGAVLHALSNVSIDVRPKEFLAIVGPSGCGKSTLLKLIVGLLKPTRGLVLHHGETIKTPMQSISMVYQQPLLLPWRNVLDNVLLPVEILRLDRQAFVLRAQALLAKVNLADFARSMPKQLSGGMKQRVALCRALVTNPSLLLMDEPFAALDALTRDEMGHELARVWAEDQKTVVFITHGIDEAVLLADRVLVMGPRPGRIRHEIAIDLPRPRREARRSHSAFNDYVETIRDMIFSMGPA